MTDLETRLTRASTRIAEPEAARCDRGREAAMAWAAGEPRRRPRAGARRGRIVAVLAPVVAVGAVVLITVFGMGTRSNEVVPARTAAVSDEVSLERIAAALDPGDRIEHSRWVEQGRRIELWSRRGGQSAMAETDPSNLIRDTADPRPSPKICSGLARDRCRTMGEALSVMIRTGHPELVGRVIEGDREVVRIRVDATMTIVGTSGTVDIDPDTLLVVGVDLKVPPRSRSTYRYEVYEFLPPTEENLRLFQDESP